jgi:hypothetical protein
MTGRPRRNRSSPQPVPKLNRPPSPPETVDPNAELKKWLAVLPKLPAASYAMSEGQYEVWLHRVAEACGAEGLKWCFEPSIWKDVLGIDVLWRSRMQNTYVNLLLDLDEKAKWSREQAARDLTAQVEEEALRIRKEAGWA